MAGRPKKKIDPRQVEQLAAIGCTQKEMAAVLDCHPDTLRDNFSAELARGEANGKIRLRKKQFDRANQGSDRMLIWLGTQYLGQTAKQQISGDEEQPVAVKILGNVKMDSL